jgi:stage IV sporulation protein FB
MRDPMTWSLPLGSVFGITIKVHILLPVVALGLILKAGLKEGAPPDVWGYSAGLMVLLFLSVLLHEFGHSFAARAVEGDSHEIMLWPLGGLASCDIPQTPRAHLITAAAGPFVNLLLFMIAGGVIIYNGYLPPMWPWWDPYACLLDYLRGGGGVSAVGPPISWIARFFYVNWMLFWFNIVLVGFPMDAGRIFQAILWPKMGFAASMRAAIFAGFITALCVGVYSIAMESVLMGFLALFIYTTCRHQWLVLETGGDEAMVGYDFSQGYTSLEREAPPRRRPSFWQRWLQKRAAERMRRELAEREGEESRMDMLLEKVQREGLQALTDEERRFLTRVSARYRNK